MNEKGLLQVFQVRFHLVTPLQITGVVSPFPGYTFSPSKVSQFFLSLRAYCLQSHCIFLLELGRYCDFICNIVWKKAVEIISSKPSS